MGAVLSLFGKPRERHAGKEPAREPSCLDGCNICLAVCEVGLWPALLVDYVKAGRYGECQKQGIDRCTDCGECTYQCPLEIPLFKYLRVAKMLSLYRGNKSGLIPVLLEVQAGYGYLPKETIRSVSDFLNLSEGQIYSVASFYKRLRLLPLGRRHITVCRGTACHVRGSHHILREMEGMVGIKAGETSPDLEYSLDTVACVGCCALAPVFTVNSRVYGKMDADKVKKISESLGVIEKNDGR